MVQDGSNIFRTSTNLHDQFFEGMGSISEVQSCKLGLSVHMLSKESKDWA